MVIVKLVADPLESERTPLTLEAGTLVRFSPLFKAKLVRLVEAGWNADASFVAAVPRPRAVLALDALVAPVPPLEMAKVPEILVKDKEEMLDVGITPIMLVARRLVRFTALLEAKLESTKEEG